MIYRFRGDDGAWLTVWAAWLLVPEEELEALKQAEGESLDVWKIAERFDVPAEIVPFRLGLGDNPYLKSIGW